MSVRKFPPSAYGMLKRLSLIAVCLVLLTPICASADTPLHPRSYSVVTSNGKFVFVMLAPVSSEDDGAFGSPEQRAESQRVRAKYSFSGLYLNDGATKPLWTVEWYAHPHFVLVPSDGEHLIRLGYWTKSLDDEALTFFTRGEEIRAYSVGDLFDTLKVFPHKWEQVFWCEDAKLDEAAHTLTLTTTLKDKYVFDYTSGESPNLARSPLKAFLVAGIIIIAALAAATIAALTAAKIKRRRARRRAV